MGSPFRGPKVVTVGVDDAVPKELQVALWMMLYKKVQEGVDLDYLQVFELAPATVDGKPVQRVLMRQEQPPLSETIDLHDVAQIVQTKLYVIDDIEVVTMLFPHEY